MIYLTNKELLNYTKNSCFFCLHGCELYCLYCFWMLLIVGLSIYQFNPVRYCLYINKFLLKTRLFVWHQLSFYLILFQVFQDNCKTIIIRLLLRLLLQLLLLLLTKIIIFFWHFLVKLPLLTFASTFVTFYILRLILLLDYLTVFLTYFLLMHWRYRGILWIGSFQQNQSNNFFIGKHSCNCIILNRYVSIHDSLNSQRDKLHI